MTNQPVDDLGPLSLFVDATGDEPSSEQVSQAQSKLMTRLANQQQPAVSTPWWPRLSLAGASAAAVMVFVFASLWPSEQQLAFAAAVDKLNQIVSFRSVTTTTQGDQVLTQVTSDYQESGQARIEIGQSLSMILDLPSATLLSLNHEAQQYRLSSIGEPGSFDLNSQSAFAFLEELKQVETKADKVLPRQLINNIWSTGFVVTVSNTTMTLWADESTGMPVSLEVTSNLSPSQTMETHVEYEFDVSFPSDHFSLQPPHGYQSD